MAGQKKDRSPEEVAQEFAGTRSVMDTSSRVNDDPEPDHARLAGLTRVGTVDDDRSDEAEIAALERELSGPATVDPPAATLENIMKMMVAALAQISAGQNQSAKIAQKALEEAARAQQPDNKIAPGISDLNPQGDLEFPRPRLKCEMFIPWEAEQEGLTWEEIELLNLLEEGEYAIKRNDGVKVGVKVQIQFNLNGKPNRLLMNSENSFNDENHWMMPTLVSILRQILASRPHTKVAAAQVVTMDERVQMVETGELAISAGRR